MDLLPDHVAAAVWHADHLEHQIHDLARLLDDCDMPDTAQWWRSAAAQLAGTARYLTLEYCPT